MKILITGADGYIGWPLFLKFIYENSNYKIDLYGEGTLRQQLSELSEKRSINVSFKGKIQFKDFLIAIYLLFKYFLNLK